MKKKGDWVTVLIVLVLVVGLSLLLYPTVANYWNQKHASRAISSYTSTVANLSEEEYKKMWLDAVEHNQSLSSDWGSHFLSDDQMAEYNDLLNIGGSGVMGFLAIPKLNVSLPIYHGASEGVLQVAIGHLEWSSLPVGGSGSHCVLSGHRGLPSAKLLSDLDQMEMGDLFELEVLGNTLTYEVDQILTVLPSEVDDLDIVQGKDYCTLVTCTPYGINSHRLLVRGHRVVEEENELRIVSEAMMVDPVMTTLITAAPFIVLLILFTAWKMAEDRKSKKIKKIENSENVSDK